MIEYGDDDFASACDAVREGSRARPRKAVTEVHGAAEKFLKAFLLFKKHEFRKYGHYLSEVLKACRQIDPDFESIAPEVKFLDKYQAEIKYPPPQPYSLIIPEDLAQEAIERARNIREFITRKLQQYGYREPEKPTG